MICQYAYGSTTVKISKYAHTPDITDFFTRQSKIVNSYSTLNVYRAATSLLTFNELGNDPGISRFFIGISNLKPAQPIYDYTWDPSLVLENRSKGPPNKNLSLEQLSKKLVILLALTTAQRVQTLSTINIKNIEKSDKHFTIKITEKIK